MASANMLALYYVDALTRPGFRPYGEAGIGVIYTDFRVEGQGVRLNFNPQAGVGADFGSGDARPWFAAFRLHHVSNGDLHEENRGINSALLLIGRSF